jgi:hypothetical protein
MLDLTSSFVMKFPSRLSSYQLHNKTKYVMLLNEMKMTIAVVLNSNKMSVLYAVIVFNGVQRSVETITIHCRGEPDIFINIT